MTPKNGRFGFLALIAGENGKFWGRGEAEKPQVWVFGAVFTQQKEVGVLLLRSGSKSENLGFSAARFGSKSPKFGFF